MKLVYTSRNPGDIQRVRSVLESAGIATMARNEIVSGLAGEVPFTECTPEVWVTDENRLAEARQILADLEQASKASEPSWVCSGCGEAIDGQFDSCWKCGTPRD